MVYDYDLVGFFYGLLTPGLSPDDIVLETILLISQSLEDESVGQIIIHHQKSILTQLLDLLRTKQDDNEITLQLLYTFYKLLLIPSTSTVLLYNMFLLKVPIQHFSSRNL